MRPEKVFVMNLPPEELARFDEEGYLFFPNRFSAEEVRVLKAAAKEVFALDREEIWRESSGVARTAFAAHTYNEAFRRLGRHPRLLEPVQQTLERPVYMEQLQLQRHASLRWRRGACGIRISVPGVCDDAMREPRAMNIGTVLLDDVTAANGPLLFLPGSHKHGVIEAGHDLKTTSYPLWTVERETVTELARQGGCAAPTGPAGSMLMFSSLMVHASPPNISPLDRTIVYLSLCHVDNHIRKFQRPAWIAPPRLRPHRGAGRRLPDRVGGDERGSGRGIGRPPSFDAPSSPFGKKRLK